MSCQQQWDNSGLQVGERTQEINAVLLTTDVTEAVVREAVAHGCNLILSHHPLIFRPLRHLTFATPQERCVALALAHGIAIYSSHTALDSVPGGISGRMARMLGLSDCPILAPESDNTGLGIVGSLPESLMTDALVSRVREIFKVPCVRFVPIDRPIRRLALCGGSGAEFLENAVSSGADAYLTADVKYHDFQAAEGRIALLDIDHWASEQHARDIFRELLEPHVPTRIACSDRSPVRVACDSVADTKDIR